MNFLNAWIDSLFDAYPSLALNKRVFLVIESNSGSIHAANIAKIIGDRFRVHSRTSNMDVLKHVETRQEASSIEAARSSSSGYGRNRNQPVRMLPGVPTSIYTKDYGVVFTQFMLESDMIRYHINYTTHKGKAFGEESMREFERQLNNFGPSKQSFVRGIPKVVSWSGKPNDDRVLAFLIGFFYSTQVFDRAVPFNPCMLTDSDIPMLKNALRERLERVRNINKGKTRDVYR